MNNKEVLKSLQLLGSDYRNYEEVFQKLKLV